MSDTEDSRAASLGRKRRQNPDVVQSAHDAEKRRKLDDNANYVALDSDDNGESVSEDRESGELSDGGSAAATAPDGDENTEIPQNDPSTPEQFDKNPSTAPNASTSLGGIDVEAIYPTSFQQFVRAQLKRGDFNSVEAVIDEHRQKKKNKPHFKNACEFAQNWKDGYQTNLSDYAYKDLQRLLKDPSAFRNPLEPEEKKNVKQSKRNFVATLQTEHEKAPWKPRAAVAFDLLKNHKTHVKASRVIRDYLDSNLLPRESRATKQQGQPKTTDLEEDAITLPPESRPTDPKGHSEATNPEQDAMIASRNDFRIEDLSEDELQEQTFYFGPSNAASLVRCLSCGDRGHMHYSCPAQTCTHCSSTSHFSRACPSHQKCKRCRQRGHRDHQCSRSSKQAGKMGDECDVCGELGHAEEECSGIWLTFNPGQSDRHKRIADNQMVVSCYNCGRATHWGDDCPALPDFVADFITFDTWSDRNASRYVISFVQGSEERDDAASMGQVESEAGQGMPAHQVQMLGEWV